MPTRDDEVKQSMTKLFDKRLGMLESSEILAFSVVCYHRCAFYTERLERKANLDDFLKA